MSKHRSIWETRFYALKQTLQWKLDSIKSRAGRKALDNDLSIDERNGLKNRLEMIEEMIKEAHRIEESPERFLYVQDR